MKTYSFMQVQGVKEIVDKYYHKDPQNLVEDAKRFCNALKQYRLISIATPYGREEDAKYRVKLREFGSCGKAHFLYNFNRLYAAFGWKVNSNGDVLTSGGNTNIINHTVYQMLNRLKRNKVISERTYNDCWKHEAIEF